MDTNTFIVLAAPFFSLLFTFPPDLLIPTKLSNNYIELVLLNLGAALGIFLVNTSSRRCDFGWLYPRIDLELILLELLEFGALYPTDAAYRKEVLYGLFMLKKFGTGVAIGVNYYLGVMLIKKKCIVFKDFMRIVLFLYMFYAAGLIVGIVLKEIPESAVPYLPITALFSLTRFVYVKWKLRDEQLKPSKDQIEASNIRKEGLKKAYLRLSESFYETDLSRNEVIERLFHTGHIKFFICFFLITVASDITPMLEFTKLAVMHSPRHMEFSYAAFHLLGTIFLYKMRNFITNKLNYYLLSGSAVSIICVLVFVSQVYLPDFTPLLLFLTMTYMTLYGASLGPFFYIFVGYRYNNLGFSICYINKWIIYALQAVVTIYIDENSSKSQMDRYRQIIITSILLLGIMIVLYFLMKEDEVVEMKIEDTLQPKRTEPAKPDDSLELRESSLADYPD